MTETADAAPANPFWRAAQICAIAFSLLGVASNAIYLWTAFSGDFAAGTLGAGSIVREHGLVTVGQIAPHSPLALAGVTDGDHLRFDRPSDGYRLLEAGESVGFTVTGGTPRHAEATVTGLSSDEYQRRQRLYQVDALSAALASLVGLFILLRARAIPSLVALGGAFAAFNYTPGVAAWQQAADAVWVMYLQGAIAKSLTVLFLAFTLLFYRENLGPIRRSIQAALGTVALVYVAGAMATSVHAVSGLESLASLVRLQPAFAAALFLAVIAVSMLGWLKSPPALRQRYTIMLAAVACFALSGIVSALSEAFLSTTGLAGVPASVQILFEVLATAAPFLFAYAVLRHKVLDIGFVINRALVYGAVSFVLLMGFGLVEWLAEKLLPANLETNALVAGGVALAIFLAFHRLRDATEHIIEGLFFCSWRDNEARLRRFVAQAPFFGSRAGLTSAYAAELSRFAGGAPSAIYLPEPDGGFSRDAGSFGSGEIGGDDVLVVAMRASRTVVEPDVGPVALGLPMNHRGILKGFALLTAKPSGEGFRPDEIEILGWATAQVGHDLYALKVEQMAEEIASLQRESDRLAAQIEFARGLGPAPKPS